MLGATPIKCAATAAIEALQAASISSASLPSVPPVATPVAIAAPTSTVVAAPILASTPAAIPTKAVGSVPIVALTHEDQWKADYAGSAALQSEFCSKGSYLAFRKANASGRGRILKMKKMPVDPVAVVSATTPQDQWKADYAGSIALQSEFRSEGAYLAFRKASANGRGCICGYARAGDRR